jgi:hypothetical protein
MAYQDTVALVNGAISAIGAASREDLPLRARR